MKYHVSIQGHTDKPRRVTAKSHLRAAEIAASRILNRRIGDIVTLRSDGLPKQDGTFAVRGSDIHLIVRQTP